MIAHILAAACQAIDRDLAASPENYARLRPQIDAVLLAMRALHRTLTPCGESLVPAAPAPHPFPPSVQYNGVRMHPSWPAQIVHAQQHRTVAVGGRTYARLPYGMEALWNEEELPPTEPCRDCGVLPGQLHVESCCVEGCPRCKEGQWITCRIEGCSCHEKESKCE